MGWAAETDGWIHLWGLPKVLPKNSMNWKSRFPCLSLPIASVSWEKVSCLTLAWKGPSLWYWVKRIGLRTLYSLSLGFLKPIVTFQCALSSCGQGAPSGVAKTWTCVVAMVCEIADISSRVKGSRKFFWPTTKQSRCSLLLVQMNYTVSGGQRKELSKNGIRSG